MKYYKYAEIYFSDEPGVTYWEIDSEVVYRSLTIIGDQYYASNIKRADGQGLALPDASVPDAEEIEELIEISKEEFDNIWQTHLSRNIGKWLEAKNNYLVGTDVVGYIECFFPQGVVITLANDVLGITSYVDCLRSTVQNMSTKRKITAFVKDYDELNQWLILERPQVYSL